MSETTNLHWSFNHDRKEQGQSPDFAQQFCSLVKGTLEAKADGSRGGEVTRYTILPNFRRGYKGPADGDDLSVGEVVIRRTVRGENRLNYSVVYRNAASGELMDMQFASNRDVFRTLAGTWSVQVDSEIGLLLEALDKSQFRDNTLIMFTMDHGEAYGQHQMFQKFSLYEASVRVPFIVASLGEGLKVPKDIRDETHFVSGVDLFPTVCDYADIDIVDGVQGLSLKPLVEGQNPAWREFAYIESNGWARSLVFDRYKYVGEYIPFGTEQDLEPIGPDPDRIGLEQIFDRVEDPDETHNLAYQSEMRDMLKRFRQLMMDFEGRLNRRRMTAQRPATQLLNWGKQIREYWDAHPELEEMRIRL